MSTFTRAKSSRQNRHPDSSDPSHQADKKAGEARLSKRWIPVEATPWPSPKREFPGLTGHAYRCVDGQWIRCTAVGEFADYLEAEARARKLYRGTTTRVGKQITMTRTAPTALTPVTVTFPPWLSDYVAHVLETGGDPRPTLTAVRDDWLPAAVAAFAPHRWVIGYAFHADTSDLHFDVICSRQDGHGGRIGKTGLGLCGPWMTAVDRQLRCGATVSPDKADKYRRSMANFHHRYGAETTPLDMLLARRLDEAADRTLGPELTPYREAYARQVPSAEQAHLRAQLELLDRARANLARQLDQYAPAQPFIDHNSGPSR